MPSQRAQALASQFATLNQELIAFVESCAAATWQAPCPGETRPIGVVAHHMAASHAPIAHLIELVATDQPLPTLTPAMLDQMNADHAVQQAACTQAEVADLLRTQGAVAVKLVAGLSDAQLDRPAQGELFGLQMNTQQLIEQVLLGHINGHFAAIRSVLE